MAHLSSTDNHVPSKTPDEIKKGLECCQHDPYNGLCHCDNGCPYWPIDKCDQLRKDALAYIQQLEREKNAAIEDIKKAALFLCQTCKYHHAMVDGGKHYCDKIPAEHFDDGAIACSMYEWHGVKEEKDENV